MKGVLVLCVSWKGPIEPTRHALAELGDAGASVVTHVGVTDVSLARSLSISHACQLLAGHPELDTLLLLDDDIAPTLDSTRALVKASRALREPVSGVYGTATGKVAAQQLEPGWWLVGLGFLAMPAAGLLSYASSVPIVTHAGQRFGAWCRTGVHPDAPEVWTSEDYWFCRTIGGVRLAPIPADHHKLLPIRPPVETLGKVADLWRAVVPSTLTDQGGDDS